MDGTFVIQNSAIGLGFDLEFGCWLQKLNGYRIYESGKRERLEGGLGLSLDFLSGIEGGLEWLASIPGDFLSLTKPYPEFQFQMLWLAANSRDAADLLKSRPVLLAILCKSYPMDNELALETLKLGQRKVLEHLGLNSSKAALKFLDKLCSDARTGQALGYVYQQLEKSFSRFVNFKHYKRVNHAALSLDHRYPFLTGTPLGIAVAHGEEGSRRRLTYYLNDTLQLGVELGIEEPIRHVIARRNLDSLKRLHDDWVARRIDQRLKEGGPKDMHIPYPVCLQETASIKQIKNYKQLSEEAGEQHHCVAVYHSRIVRERYAVFKMVEPERMTIGISIERNLEFPYRIEQISGYRNKTPAEQTRATVYQWFEQCKSSYEK